MPAPVPKKVRRCKECKEVFATPESLRKHKRVGGECRSLEALRAVGFVSTKKGWLLTCIPPNSNR